MNNVVVFQQIVSANFDGFFKADIVKNESISTLSMKLLESCSTVSVATLNESLTVYLLVVNGSKIGPKYFASLYVGVCKADKIGLKGGQPSTRFYALYKNHTLFQV